ncbi:NAD(P)-binding protein [Sistotremastrum suecicum HHB10207 ss-3]|uniref:NAD(P)-binding protein n=1 Tax=Sistotremastrum suecicum HHB10207 ss-3 TaxID=1314776 RepID=A0A165YQP2_9AGAM|nr:NAD(P)-binding protein [Sistotremastrum suecicum HHB10207 ss-3]
MAVPNEELPVTMRHELILIKSSRTGPIRIKLCSLPAPRASRGIGEEIALFYAKAGASLALVARQQSTLDEVRNNILKQASGAAIITFVADVIKTDEVQAAVNGTVEKFAHYAVVVDEYAVEFGVTLAYLDIVIANAGKGDPWEKPFTESDPDNWWNTIEVNLRGVYNVAHYSLPHLDQTSGYFITTSSRAAQGRRPNASAYSISKHAVGRLNEFIKIEHPKVKSIAVHPGGVKTAMAAIVPQIHHLLVDSPQLAAGTMLQLTSGKYDWLSGRYYASTWDLGEVERDWKDKILAEEALVSRLAIPS